MLAFHKEKYDLLKEEHQGKWPTIMLSLLVIHKKIIPAEHMKDTTHIKCQLHHLHLEQYLVKTHDQNRQYLC